VTRRQVHRPADRALTSPFGTRRILTSVLAAVVAALLVAAPAHAATTPGPWWQLSSGSRPTNLKAGVAQNEVQEVTVSATGGEFVLFEANFNFRFFPWNATHEEVQTGLEGIYGAGNVEVSGGPGDEEGTSPYRITFTGVLGDQPVAPLSAVSLLSCEGATGPNCRAEATVVEKTRGKPDGEVVLTIANIGDASVDGATVPVQISDTLPPGLKAVGIAATEPEPGGSSTQIPLSCSLETLSCSSASGLAPYDQIEVRIAIVVEAGANAEEVNEVSVTGGGAPSASLSRPLRISAEPTPFGVEDLRLRFEGEGGTPATGAGSHPFQFTTTVTINQGPDVAPLGATPEAEPAALAKDVYTKLPPGLFGNPTPFPTCTLAQFLTNVGGEENRCPPQTALGVVSATVNEPILLHQLTFTQPLFNLEPAFGEPARLGFFVPLAHVPVVLDTALRSGPGEDYGINVSATNISQTASLSSARVTVWGVPGDARHDNSRGWGCLGATRGREHHAPCNPAEEHNPPPFLTLPTSCTGPLRASVEADPWERPGQFQDFPPSEPLQALDGCNQVPFSPKMAAEPTSDSATSPTGLNFDLNVNDEGLLNPAGLVQSEIKKAVVTLPEGMSANPSVAEGLHACTLAQYESETVNSAPGTGCPNESKIGDVEIESPLVTQKIHGSVFVAKPYENEFHSLLALYMVAKNPALGVLIRSAGKVDPNPVSGQLVTTFDNIPQLPFSHFHLSFRQGQRSPLVTPPDCGSYTVNADLYPYSDPGSPIHEESSFRVVSGPEGTPCPAAGTPPFKPDFLAGTLNNVAGHFSPFYARLSRRDSEQEITRFSVKLPPGLIGKLAGIPFCPDAAIVAAKARTGPFGGAEELDAPSCPAASEVGRTMVGAGVGGSLTYVPGKLYLAGPYHGLPLSVVAITAAKAGPFDLGTVVVREALRIDPETAEVSVDAAGSDPLPHILQGIPVHLRDIRIHVERPEFVLNPTSCERTSTASTVLGSGLSFTSEADDVPVTVSSPFQAADCAALPFKPKLKLSLIGGTRRGAHPRLSALLKMRGIGEAAIARAQVTLPRSEFIENAHFNTICTRVQFKAGSVPGEQCPAGSVYGHAKAITPILDEPLAGPVYLRSSEHKLPDLVAALHNRLADIVLDGRIDSVKGQLRSTFEAVPDAPVSSFVLKMAGGKKGLFVNSTNLCEGTHRAIARFAGHNGKVEHFKPKMANSCKKRRATARRGQAGRPGGG
jgi:hypothetical protein